MASAEDADFESSVLGTKQYWEQSYEKEIENFEDHGDEGEIWFGKATLRRLVDWMAGKVDTSASVLDIGCGNGTALVALAKRGFVNLHGWDYCEPAIRLARMVTEREDIAATFTVADVLDEKDPEHRLLYDVCFDKGTYDAISLSPDSAVDKRKRYAETVMGLLAPKGTFVLTSCNWTERELVEQFHAGFQVTESIPMPQFRFGDRTGQMVTSLVFQRNPSAFPCN